MLRLSKKHIHYIVLSCHLSDMPIRHIPKAQENRSIFPSSLTHHSNIKNISFFIINLSLTFTWNLKPKTFMSYDSQPYITEMVIASNDATTIHTDGEPTIHIEHFFDINELEKVSLKLQWNTTHLPKSHKDVLEELWIHGQQGHCVQGPRSNCNIVQQHHCQIYWVSLWSKHLLWRPISFMSPEPSTRKS